MGPPHDGGQLGRARGPYHGRWRESGDPWSSQGQRLRLLPADEGLGRFDGAEHPRPPPVHAAPVQRILLVDQGRLPGRHGVPYGHARHAGVAPGTECGAFGEMQSRLRARCSPQRLLVHHQRSRGRGSGEAEIRIRAGIAHASDDGPRRFVHGAG